MLGSSNSNTTTEAPNDNNTFVTGAVQTESEETMNMLVFGVLLIAMMITALFQSFVFSKVFTNRINALLVVFRHL